MEHRLYFVRCVATYTGNATERNLKDHVRQFDGMLCNLDGWRQILWSIQDCNAEFNATHPRCTRTDVKFEYVGGAISMTIRDATGNFRLLEFDRVKEFFLDKATLKIADGGNTAIEDEGGKQ